jgi:hypothetical protein
MELENTGGDAASGVSDPTMPGCCGTKILKKAWAALPKETQNLVSAALEAPDLNAVSLGKERVFTAAEAIVWVAAAGLEVAAGP